ncbi:MAG TPA: hypothetical protein VFE36_09625 [Candidatus Baltobacteraceae bacterium]|jgi:hypothetical protein|nr:hypothetical protein [Candidatus Baltobacteraceae bacterium]
MDASWIAAIASVASAFVVGVAAIAAVLQIRHIRNANEITIYLHLADRLESANAAEAFRSYAEFALLTQTDRTLRDRLAQPQGVPEFQPIETLLRFLDTLSMLIIHRSITERLILLKYADEIDRLWDHLAEAVYLRRRGIPHFASIWEHLAMRAKAYIAAGEIDRFYGSLQRDSRITGVDQ